MQSVSLESVRFVADMNSNKKIVIVRIHIFRVGILKFLKEYDVIQSKLNFAITEGFLSR